MINERNERLKANLEDLVNNICRKEMKYLNNYEFEEKSWETGLEIYCNTVTDAVLAVLETLSKKGISPKEERIELGVKYAYLNYKGKVFRMVEWDNLMCESGINKMLMNYVGTNESVKGIINDDIIVSYEEIIE